VGVGSFVIDYRKLFSMVLEPQAASVVLLNLNIGCERGVKSVV
jgi:hypothetical protein